MASASFKTENILKVIKTALFVSTLVLGGCAGQIAEGRVSSNDSHNCLAQAIYYESKSEPLQGQLAVGNVVLNRTRSGRYPQSICGVVFQRSGRNCQFSWSCRPHAKPYGALWTKSQNVASQVLSGSRDNTQGALSFNNRPFRAGRLTTKIGGHYFYRPGKKS